MKTIIVGSPVRGERDYYMVFNIDIQKLTTLNQLFGYMAVMDAGMKSAGRMIVQYNYIHSLALQCTTENNAWINVCLGLPT